MICLFIFFKEKQQLFKTCLLRPSHYFPIWQSVTSESKNLQLYQGHCKYTQRKMHIVLTDLKGNLPAPCLMIGADGGGGFLGLWKINQNDAT